MNSTDFLLSSCSMPGKHNTGYIFFVHEVCINNKILQLLFHISALNIKCQLFFSHMVKLKLPNYKYRISTLESWGLYFY